MRTVLIAGLLFSAALAQAGPGDWRPFRPQLQGDPRHMPPAGGRERWEERRRLLDEVRGGKMSRDDAVRQYREKFPERPSERHHQERRRLSPEEREQLRRDILDANRGAGKR